MASKLIKLSRKDDLGSAIKHIKTSKESEVIFEVETGSPVLNSSEGMKLLKKTGDMLKKKIKIVTDDETGKILAKKAGVSDDEGPVKMPNNQRVARSDVKPKFSDIRMSRRLPASVAGVAAGLKPSASKLPVTNYVAPKSYNPVVRTETEEGSRLEIEMDRGSSKFSKFFILGLVVLVTAVFALAVLLPKADITVFARSEPITRDFEITVDRLIASADRSTMQIPGIPVSKEVSHTKSYSTTGIRISGAPASGTVTIYNMTGNILRLNAATTTLVAGGKSYSLESDAAGLRANGPTTGIKIVAQTGGATSNLPANTRFQIINAALGNANVYAENPQALSGGADGEQTRIFSQEDYDLATEDLMKEAVAQVESTLTAEHGTSIRVLDSGSRKEILARTANVNVGAETDSFDMTLIARVNGLAFRENDVNTVVVSKINEVLSADKYLLDLPDKKIEAAYSAVDLAANRGMLNVHFETTAAYKVEEGDLAQILAGKNEFEIIEILRSKPAVDDVEVEFWPAWFVHKAPKFNGKIKIVTEIRER